MQTQFQELLAAAKFEEATALLRSELLSDRFIDPRSNYHWPTFADELARTLGNKRGENAVTEFWDGLASFLQKQIEPKWGHVHKGYVYFRLGLNVAAFKERKEQLIEAFVYQGAIDKALFQEQLDKLKEETTQAEIQLNEVRLEELDVEAVLNFSEYVFLNAGRLWFEASLDQKQRLQGVIFPGGVTFLDGTFGTAKTCLAFNLLQTPILPKNALVSPTGFEPVLLP